MIVCVGFVLSLTLLMWVMSMVRVTPGKKYVCFLKMVCQCNVGNVHRYNIRNHLRRSLPGCVCWGRGSNWCILKYSIREMVLQHSSDYHHCAPDTRKYSLISCVLNLFTAINWYSPNFAWHVSSLAWWTAPSWPHWIFHLKADSLSWKVLLRSEFLKMLVMSACSVY